MDRQIGERTAHVVENRDETGLERLGIAGRQDTEHVEADE
jgi:hypothetical protein